MSVKIALTVVLLLLVDLTHAHGLAAEVDEAVLSVILGGVVLTVFGWLYGIGLRHSPATTERWTFFLCASLISALILIVPLHDRIDSGSALHMIQHMLILVVIAPLFVLARPLPQWAAASRGVVVLLIRPWLRLGRYPMWAGFLQAAVIWFWHSPKFYNMTLENPWLHLMEHISFALGAGVFWWAILIGKRTIAALLALLITLIHTGMLGALLTFTQIILYADSHNLQDQQLAGLIMWVPGSLFYLIAGGWCGLRWLRDNLPTVKSV